MALVLGGSVKADAAVDALKDGSWSGVVLHRIGTRQLEQAMLAVKTWRASRNGLWFEAPGQPPVDLSRRRKIRLVLKSLLASHAEQPGQVVPRTVLLDAAWPGEVQNPSLHNRLYVAISTLRRAGMTLVLRAKGGYWLDPEVPIQLSDASLEELPSVCT